jgi:hypothetical protein
MARSSLFPLSRRTRRWPKEARRGGQDSTALKLELPHRSRFGAGRDVVGKVENPDTVEYKTHRPIRDGLFVSEFLVQFPAIGVDVVGGGRHPVDPHPLRRLSSPSGRCYASVPYVR